MELLHPYQVTVAIHIRVLRYLGDVSKLGVNVWNSLVFSLQVIEFFASFHVIHHLIIFFIIETRKFLDKSADVVKHLAYETTCYLVA